MNAKGKPVVIIRNPFSRRTFRVMDLIFFSLVVFGYDLDQDQVYASAVLVGKPHAYTAVEDYITKRFADSMTVR